jgi:hypothetical protein
MLAHPSRKITSSRMLTNKSLPKKCLQNNSKQAETSNGLQMIERDNTCLKPPTQSN